MRKKILLGLLLFFCIFMKSYVEDSFITNSDNTGGIEQKSGVNLSSYSFGYTSWTLFFNANGGGGVMGNQTFQDGIAQQINYNSFGRAGYTFAGWSTTPGGSVIWGDGWNMTLTSDATVYAVWTGTTYTVSFNRNTGLGTMSGQTFTEGVPQNLTANSFTKAGYAFIGWAVTSGGSVVYADKESYTALSDRTLYAKWGTADTISFNSNGGTGTMADQIFPSGIAQDINANSFTYGGYTFIGWATTAGGSVAYADGGSYTSAGNATLYAKWVINRTVTFNANGGTGTMAAQIFPSGVAQNLNANSFTYVGYTFAGWATTAGGAVAYADQASYTTSANVTLYAKWTINIYTVSFNSNTGSGSMGGQSFTHGVAQNLTTNSFTKTGYTFIGWATTAGGSVAYADEESYTATDNTTLYAKWAINRTVTFNANTGTGTMTAQIVPSGVAQNLNLNTFTKAGYAFAGWATTSGGVVAYADGASHTTSVNRTLYAKWVVAYTVSFDANGGTGTMTGQTYASGVAQNLNANSFTYIGYTFEGWATTAGGIVAYADGASYTATDNATLYAKWTPITYTISFNANSGSGSMTGQTFTHGVPQNLNANSFTRASYTFIGWATSLFGSVAYADEESYTATGNVTLYAKWAINRTVTFNANSGTGTMASQVFPSGVAQNLNANSFTRTGYTFAGWATTAGGVVAYADGASYTTSANATLYAKWTANIYTVSFDANTGSGSMSGQSFTYGIAQNLTANSFTKTGYTFAGWATTAGGSVAYADGASYTPSASDITIYAKWTVITYTIGYTLNGGSVDPANPTTYTIESSPITLTNPTKAGYDFAGWTGTGLGSATATVTISTGSTGNRAYTATWTLITYTISYTLNDGTVAPANPTTYTIESSPITLTNPTKAGYDFAGWTGTELGAPTATVTISAGSTGNRAYTATWTPITYTIDYTLNGGTAEPANPTTYTIENSEITLTNPTKAGYDFAGWTGTELGAPTATVTISAGSTGNRAYTATWTLTTYTISYTLNGGTVAIANPTTYTIESGAIILNNPSMEGYNFIGWTGADLELITTIVTIPAGSTGDRTYTANWLETVYTITYNLAGGVVSPENPTTYTIGADAITLNNPTRAEYTFTGWTGSNGEVPGNVTIPSGSTDNRTYTANWRIENQAIITATAGANGAISPSGAIAVNMGTNKTFIIVADPGYIIDTLRIDGELVDVTGCYIFSNISSDRAIAVTFKQETGEVLESYRLKENLESASVITSMTGGETISFQYTPQAGFSFAGWVVNYGGISIADPMAETITFTMPNKPAEITAKILHQFTVTFSANGGTGSMSDQIFVEEAAQNLTANSFTRVGYSFAGWDTSSSGTTAVYTDQGSYPALGNATLYAVWIAE